MLRVSRQLSWGKLLLVFVIIAAAAMLSSTTSFAAVTSTNANVDLKAPPPSSVLESDNANSSEIWIFQKALFPCFLFCNFPGSPPKTIVSLQIQSHKKMQLKRCVWGGYGVRLVSNIQQIYLMSTNI